MPTRNPVSTTAIDNDTTAAGTLSVAIDSDTTAAITLSIPIDSDTAAAGTLSIAIDGDTTAAITLPIAIDGDTTAAITLSIPIDGDTTAAGTLSIAIDGDPGGPFGVEGALVSLSAHLVCFRSPAMSVSTGSWTVTATADADLVDAGKGTGAKLRPSMRSLGTTRGRVRRRHAPRAVALSTVVALSPCVARAAPQASIGLTVGGGAEEAVGPDHARGALELGGRGDVLFFRNRGADMAIGPYVDVSTLAFESVDFAAGATWLVPVRDDVPLAFSEGLLLRSAPGRSWTPGMATGLFFGSRSYNFHSWYGMAAGFFIQSSWIPSSPATLDVVAGLRIDAEILALPALLVIGAFKGN